MPCGGLCHAAVYAMRRFMPCGGLWKTWIVRITAWLQSQAGSVGYAKNLHQRFERLNLVEIAEASVRISRRHC